MPPSRIPTSLSTADELYLTRACELAARGIGNVSPNPPVGSVLVAQGQTLGEGYHHCRGEAHAEVEALRDAYARGSTAEALQTATLYVSLEPCNHHGRTPPCSEAIVAAGIKRVVIGTLDPNPRTACGGVARLEAAGIEVQIADLPQARTLITHFAHAMSTKRPYVTLKMAASLDGHIAPQPGSYWLTGHAARRYVRELRAAHDLALIGAGTARIDNPALTLRPPRTRRRPLLRAIVAGRTPLAPTLQIFAQSEARTLLCVPESALAAYAAHAELAEIIPVPTHADGRLALLPLLQALARHDVGSIICEGGPSLAAGLIAEGLVDAIEWLIAPTFLATPQAVAVLASTAGVHSFKIEGVRQLENDVHVSLRPVEPSQEHCHND